MVFERIHIFFIIVFTLIFIFGQNTMAQQPDPPTITSITIEPSDEHPGAVRLYWLPSPTEGVTGYILWRYIKDETHNGYQIVTDDLAADEYMYLDENAQAHIKSESFYMAAYINDKQYFGLPSPAHHTIFLNPIKYDSCKMTNTLTWTPYKGWDSGANYNIYRNDDTDPIQPGISDTTYTDNHIDGNITYSYYIKAIKNANSNFTSTSNTASIYTTPINHPDSTLFYFYNIAYNGNSANFTVNIDNTADLHGHSLMISSKQTTGYSEVEFKQFDNEYQTIEFSHNTINQPLYYKVKAINVCGDTIMETDVVQPIVLNAESNETEVTLEWNSSFIESMENYNISIIVDGTQYLPENTNENTAYFVFEEIDPQNTAEVFCFTIEALETNGNTSYSNEICVSRIPKIEPPTAFSPNGDGLNDVFGPFWESGNENSYIKNAIITEFKLIIYDKYGGAVFATDNSDDKWNGTANGGRAVTEGGYIYYMWFKTLQGKTYEKSATINVVYP